MGGSILGAELYIVFLKNKKNSTFSMILMKINY